MLVSLIGQKQIIRQAFYQLDRAEPRILKIKMNFRMKAVSLVMDKEHVISLAGLGLDFPLIPPQLYSIAGLRRYAFSAS